MLYLPLSKIVDSGEVALAPGAVILAEGQALSRQPGNMSAGVSPSQGVANEKFAGFAIAGVSAAPFAEGYAAKVETFVVPTAGSVTLALTPAAGQVSVFDKTAGSADTSITVAGKVVSGLTAGNTVVVTYKYALTVDQMRARSGDVQPGGYAGAVVSQIGAAKRGVIYTDQFDASIDWSAVSNIQVGANGQLVASGDGPVIDGFVVSVPTADIPFLGIEFTVA